MVQPSFDRLEKRIGYHFQNKGLLMEALTHSSYAQEVSQRVSDNERMEFLGDAVLNLAVTVRLTQAFPDYDEGKLSLARAGLVAANHLAKVAAGLELGKYLRLSPSEEKSGGRNKPNILADALEALLAAIFCDGGLAPATAFVERMVLPPDLSSHVNGLLATNYKGALQERLQAEHQPVAHYHVVEEDGLEHEKTFTVEVQAGDGVVARGSGGSKKAAQQQAAKRALEILAAKVEADG